MQRLASCLGCWQHPQWALFKISDMQCWCGLPEVKPKAGLVDQLPFTEWTALALVCGLSLPWGTSFPTRTVSASSEEASRLCSCPQSLVLSSKISETLPYKSSVNCDRWYASCSRKAFCLSPHFPQDTSFQMHAYIQTYLCHQCENRVSTLLS